MMVTGTSPAGRPALQVLVDVDAFETRAEGQVVLVARWVVADGASRRTIAAQQTSLVGAIAGRGDSAVVAAMSRLVEELAAQLAVSTRRGITRIVGPSASPDTHSLFRQGCMLYELIANMPEHRPNPLIQAFDKAASNASKFNGLFV